MDEISQNDRQMAAIAYAGGGLSPLIALFVWLTAKNDFVKEHGKRAAISHFVIAAVVTLLVFVTCGFGAPLILVAWGWGFYEAMQVSKADG